MHINDLLWYPITVTKNGSASTLNGYIACSPATTLTKMDISWSNPVSFSIDNLLIFTFNDNYPTYPFICSALIGTTVTYAYYNSTDHGVYVKVPNGTYTANNVVRIFGIMGHSTF